jgi:hypothetical protein
MTQENGGNKTSHIHSPTKYTTTTAAPGKEKHTYAPLKNTLNRGSDHTEKKFHNITLPEFHRKGYFYN